ncbi:HAD family hydrolase [Novosphingobium sp. FSY-8]|uniref:HAD family hydrolase n=1 Tax=Novosphingobium ovatum TaxID=1908523 RepID=A0ABW9XG37_9SPHN|nr:HAD family hydrolase [Novosphingobium ovatum]NBC37505.1 HAD family hydrolase [Novosphingobium ovatum]
MTAPIAPAAFAPLTPAPSGLTVLPGLPGSVAANALIPPPAPPVQRPTEVLPHQLPDALVAFGDCTVLSLDCFDTLLWRDCHAPVHLFSVLPQVTTMQRGRAEHNARRASSLSGRGQDVPIDEIYQLLMPNADAQERQAAIRAELDAEAQHCFAFAPTVELMRRAKARGMRVIIVSDTYLDEAMLRELIARAAGDDVAALIDDVFVSSHWRKPKAAGLYQHVLDTLKLPATTILHLGDNHGADVKGVMPFGVHTLHLKQFGADIEQQLRLESCVDSMLCPNDSELISPQPHRAAVAHWSPQLTDKAQHFGYAVLGPVFTGFDRWLEQEAKALQARHGGRVHWLFLMRDGYLPMVVHQARCPDDTVHQVEISRFTSTAATFSDNKAIDDYIGVNLGTMPDVLARQVMLPEADVRRLTANVPPLEGTVALRRHLNQPSTRKFIHKAARRMADRIVTHVRQAVRPEAGDTLMLIDLGYNGSVQNNIDALLAKALKVQVAGRYLVLRETEFSGLDKAGYFDTPHYDMRALNAMTSNIAVVEQMCTTGIGSVIDYYENGKPIRKTNDIKQTQSAVREACQQGCAHFAESHAGHIIRAQRPDEITQWRRANAASIMRLMFLPLPYELGVFSSFEHDVNLGTDEKVALFDSAIAERGLRQQGMFYQKGVRRMFLSAEIANQGLPTRLTHLTYNRFALGLTVSDFINGGIMVPTIYSNGQEVVQTRLNAMPTHDGFHTLCIPISDCRFTAAIQFGAVFDWMEIYSVSAMPSAEHLNNMHDTWQREVPLHPILDGIEQVSANLWHCQRETGFALINPPERGDNTAMTLLVVFRPVTWRAGAQDANAAAVAAFGTQA